MRYFPLRFKDLKVEKEFLAKTNQIIYKFYIITLVVLGIMCFYSIFLDLKANDKFGVISTSAISAFIFVVLVFRKKLKIIIPFVTVGLGVFLISINLYAARLALKPLPPVILLVYFNGFMVGIFYMFMGHLFLKFQVKVIFFIAAVTVRWVLLPMDNLLVLLNCSFVDIANLLVMYYYERNNRTLFKSFYDYRNELSKFRIILTEHLPHNILILNKKLDQKLFANNSFTSAFKVESLDQIKGIFSTLKININTLDQSSSNLNLSDSTFLGQTDPTLQDFLNYAKNDNKDEGHINCFNVDYLDAEENKITFEVKVFHLDWDGTPAITIMLNDLTQQQTILALKIADENKDRLLATVSHELRTPINGMLGVTQIIEQEYKDPKLLSYCKSAKVCAKMLLNLVNSILDLAQIRNKCIRLNPTAFELRDMIEEVESIFRPQCVGKNNIEFVIKKDRGLPRKLVSDQNRLMQVIINLLANALKFTFHGQIVLKVTKGENEGEIQFSIQDSGTGIKDEDKPKLFKAFGKVHQTNPKINTQGVGLGLTISNSLVKLLHPKKPENKIQFESVYGEGTTFFFSISTKLIDNLNAAEENEDKSPEKFTRSESGVEFSKSIAEYSSDGFLIDPLLIKALSCQNNLPSGFLNNFNKINSDQLGSILISLPNEEKGLVEDEIKFANEEGHKSSVLVVDDNSLNLMIATKLLEKLDFDVSTAFNGQEAIQKVRDQDRKNFFKLILMDCQMPVMDGLEATQVLRKMMKLGEVPEIPIFALSANDSNNDQKRCMEAGMSGYLSKPLKVEELQKVLKKLIN